MRVCSCAVFSSITPFSINLKGQQQNFQRQFTQELRLASNGTNKIDYVAGLFYFWQKIRGYGENQLGADFAEWNLNPLNPVNTPTQIANGEAPQGRAFRIGGLPDIVAHGLTGHLAEPFDTRDLADGLNACIEDARGEAQRGSASRERALRTWSASSVVASYRELYEEALS